MRLLDTINETLTTALLQLAELTSCVHEQVASTGCDIPTEGRELSLSQNTGCYQFQRESYTY